MARSRIVSRPTSTSPSKGRARTRLAKGGRTPAGEAPMDCATPRPHNPESIGFEPTAEGFATLHDIPALTRVAWIKRGLGARDAKAILGQFTVPQGEALTALQIPVATMNRKARTNAPLSPAEGERVLGLARLLGQLEIMVRESGDPKGFSAASWLSAWMSAAVPALSGMRPLDLMDTMTGQALVSQVLSQMQSGAYA